MGRSRNSGLNRSSASICSSVSVTVRSAEVFSRRSRRSWRLSKPCRLHTPRTPVELTWMPASASSLATRRAPRGRDGQAVIEDRLLDLLGHPVGMRWPRAGDLVEQAFGAVGLEVAADRV